MAWGMDDCIVGGQLRVGTGLVPAIKEGDEKIKKECRDEIRDIKKWLRKWKPKAKRSN